MTYADRSGDAFMREVTRCTLADALHQAGRRAEAETRFREAEQMQQERQPDYPLLYSLPGCRYCDLLLAAPERAAWQAVLGRRASVLECGGWPPLSSAGCAGELPGTPTPAQSGGSASASPPHSKTLREVRERAAQTLKWMQADSGAPLLDIALDHLTLGRAVLYEAILQGGAVLPRRPAGPQPGPTEADLADLRLVTSSATELDAAVSGLRRANRSDYLPRGFLTRAWLRFLTGACTGPESAQADLDEAWEIAERGPMKLFLADIHLSRARLFGRQKEEGGMQKYPWESPAKDLAEAEKLINACGYHRRDEELADAKRAILGV